MKDERTLSLAVIGLGYVGLPLAMEFAKKFKVVGFDKNPERVRELWQGKDRTREYSPDEIRMTPINFTTDPEELKESNVFIVAVPTPIDQFKKPDLGPLLVATKTVGKYLKKGDTVIFESTVYPGCTEEECIPLLENISGMAVNEDFHCGYSPERMNPGDKGHGLTQIKKITSGSNEWAANFVNQLYGTIIEAGTYLAPTIKVAEASKVVENAQRDVNIAFVNELALIFNRMKIDTREVLQAASTKWNFWPFSPGLVGRHCIGVDPYYLTNKAETYGVHAEVMLAGRRVNESMGRAIAEMVLHEMILAGRSIQKDNIILLGATFKENCTDIRNSRVFDIVKELQRFGARIQIHDPYAHSDEVKKEYGQELVGRSHLIPSPVLIFAVAHKEFQEMTLKDIKSLSVPNPILMDVKGLFSRDFFKDMDCTYLRL